MTSTAPGARRTRRRRALADLFFHAPTLSEEDKIRANDLRRKYRDWRSAGGTVPHADVLDLNHEAATSESRSEAKLKRVKTVGACLSNSVVSIGHTPSGHTPSMPIRRARQHLGCPPPMCERRTRMRRRGGAPDFKPSTWHAPHRAAATSPRERLLTSRAPHPVWQDGNGRITAHRHR